MKFKSEVSVVEELAETAASFVLSWNPGVEFILPVPPSRLGRPVQPVLLLAAALGRRMGIPERPDCIRRVKEVPELKNVYDFPSRVRLLQGAHSVEQAVVEGKKVLLVDDLFRSGATMNAITEVLYDQARVTDVFALTITRTRSKR